jgi:hypothetical protein
MIEIQDFYIDSLRKERMRLDLSVERDILTGPPFEEHTLSLQLLLSPQEKIEAEVFFCDPEYVVANCMKLSSEGVTLWKKTADPQEPFVPVRPWILHLKDVTEGFVFSSSSASALDPLERYFRNDWLRNFRREWSTRKSFWTTKPQEFAVEGEKARGKIAGIILD